MKETGNRAIKAMKVEMMTIEKLEITVPSTDFKKRDHGFSVQSFIDKFVMSSID